MDNNDETDANPKRKDRRIRPPGNQQIYDRKKPLTNPQEKEVKEHQYPVNIKVRAGDERSPHKDRERKQKAPYIPRNHLV